MWCLHIYKKFLKIKIYNNQYYNNCINFTSMKTMKLTYHPNGTYTIGIDNWTLTGTLKELSDTLDEIFEPEQFVERVKNYINSK